MKQRLAKAVQKSASSPAESAGHADAKAHDSLMEDLLALPPPPQHSRYAMEIML